MSQYEKIMVVLTAVKIVIDILKSLLLNRKKEEE